MILVSRFEIDDPSCVASFLIFSIELSMFWMYHFFFFFSFFHSSKTYCGYCTSVKKLLSGLGANYKVIELDVEGKLFFSSSSAGTIDITSEDLTHLFPKCGKYELSIPFSAWLLSSSLACGFIHIQLDGKHVTTACRKLHEVLSSKTLCMFIIAS